MPESDLCIIFMQHGIDRDVDFSFLHGTKDFPCNELAESMSSQRFGNPNGFQFQDRTRMFYESSERNDLLFFACNQIRFVIDADGAHFLRMFCMNLFDGLLFFLFCSTEGDALFFPGSA